MGKRRSQISGPLLDVSPALARVDASGTTNGQRLHFCFRHVQKGFAGSNLQPAQARAALCEIERLSGLTWGELLQMGKRRGTESLPVRALWRTPPDAFRDVERVTVIRFDSENGRIIGIRDGRVFCVLWFDVSPFKVYGHG